MRLTPKQSLTLAFIKEYIAEHGHVPTLEKMAEHFQRKIPTMHQRLASLKKKGLLSSARQPANVGESIYIQCPYCSAALNVKIERNDVRL